MMHGIPISNVEPRGTDVSFGTKSAIVDSVTVSPDDLRFKDGFSVEELLGCSERWAWEGPSVALFLFRARESFDA